MTSISHIYSQLTITRSLLHFDFQRQHSLSPSLSYILTSRDSTLSLSYILTSRDSTLSLSLSLSYILTSRDSTLSLSLSLLHFDFQRQHSLSPSLSYILTSRDSLALPASDTQFNTRNMGAYILCNLFLSCSAFSAGLVPVLHTASDILSNPKRDKWPTHLPKIHLGHF